MERHTGRLSKGHPYVEGTLRLLVLPTLTTTRGDGIMAPACADGKIQKLGEERNLKHGAVNSMRWGTHLPNAHMPGLGKYLARYPFYFKW